MDRRCPRGGIVRLRELIAEHPAEVAYDFRERFGVGISAIGREIPYLEAIYLVAVILRDPASWTQAARAGWDYPVSREWIVASHTYDLLALANSGKGKKPKPYPHPFPSKASVRTGQTTLSHEEVVAVLKKMNPKEP